MTDKEHVDRIKAALDVLCECIDDARAAGLIVDVSVDACDTWQGRRDDGVPQVRNRGVKARREYA